jgi:hypothetical protein
MDSPRTLNDPAGLLFTKTRAGCAVASSNAIAHARRKRMFCDQTEPIGVMRDG